MAEVYYNSIRYISKACLYPFLISIILFRLPDFYFLPGGNTIFTTQVLARLIIGLIFCIKILETFFNDKKILNSRSSKLIVGIIITIFLLQSVSILYAINYQSFVFRYFKDIFPGILSLFTFYFYRSEVKKIILVILLPIIFNIGYQTFMLLDQSLFVSLFRNIIYKRHLSFILYNFTRGRLFIDTYDEASIPLLLLTNSLKSPLKYLLFISIAFLAFISSWRIRVVLVIFALTSSYLALKKILTKQFLIIALAILSLALITDSLSSTLTGFSFIDRFTLGSEIEDVAPLSFRLNQLSTVIDMGFSSPVGVGMGNYYDNLPQNYKKSGPSTNKDILEGGIGNVHNIFGTMIAESGYLSFILFVILLIIFSRADIRILKQNNYQKMALVLCFWTMFIHSLLNPNVGGAYIVFFWGMRGLLL